MAKLKWYFDYVSPFSYLQWAHQLPRLRDREIELKPVLFAGLLKHWGHKGPAEIPGKRRFTYRHTVWLAERLGVPFTMPSAHPFNPLPLLRLTIARDTDTETVDRLFGFVWREGRVPADETAWEELTEQLEVSDDEFNDPVVKDRLRSNGEEALAEGVFGVPSFVIDHQVFWGVDGFDFLLEFLDDPSLLDTPAMRTADNVPTGV